MIKLVEGKGKRGWYLELSHCWGLQQHITTTKTSPAQHSIGIPQKDLPKTSQDAVDLDRSLEVQYLWIDSLCIVQDDQTEWEVESANMANIYSRAFLVLSATASSNSAAGCLSRRWNGPGPTER